MKGWKTYLGSIGFILVGVYKIFNNSSDGIEYIFMGLSIMGIGHKIDKINK
jgi:hypothetical protein